MTKPQLRGVVVQIDLHVQNNTSLYYLTYSYTIYLLSPFPNTFDLFPIVSHQMHACKHTHTHTSSTRIDTSSSHIHTHIFTSTSHIHPHTHEAHTHTHTHTHTHSPTASPLQEM